MLSKRSGDFEKIFSTTHLDNNLRSRSLKSIGVTLTAQAIKLVLKLTLFAILARILNPSDFGLVAMVGIFTGLGVILMEGGLSMATIQRKEISHAQVSNLFWVNLGLGALLSIVTVILSPIVSWFYNEPRLTLIMIVMSLTFFIGGLSVQHDAILRRQMRFKDIAIIDIVSMLLGGLAGLVVAMISLSYWALVVNPIVTYIIKALMCWYYVKWVPQFFKRSANTKSHFDFGVHLTGANFIGYFTKNIIPLSVSFVGGVHYLGLYNRAFTLASIPTTQLLPPVMNVLKSSVSRVADDRDHLKSVALSLMSKVAIITILVSILMYLSAHWIVLIMLGDAWIESVEILKIITIASIATPITTLTAVVLISVGEVKALLKWKIITFLILALSVVLGAFWGVIGILWAYALSAVFIRVPLFFIYASRYQPVKAIDYMKVLLPAVFSGLMTVLLVKLLEEYFSPDSVFLAIAWYFIFVPFIYFLFCIVFKRTRNDLFDVFFLIKKILKL